MFPLFRASVGEKTKPILSLNKDNCEMWARIGISTNIIKTLIIEDTQSSHAKKANEKLLKCRFHELNLPDDL